MDGFIEDYFYIIGFLPIFALPHLFCGCLLLVVRGGHTPYYPPLSFILL